MKEQQVLLGIFQRLEKCSENSPSMCVYVIQESVNKGKRVT